MNYENLKQGIKAIADIANGVPEMFRARCFELLLQHLLDSTVSKGARETPPVVERTTKEEIADIQKGKHAPDPPSIPTPSQVLFQGQMEAQGEAQKLSIEGQKELGRLVKELAATGS